VGGTGFLLKQQTLITNHHVIADVQSLAAKFDGLELLVDCELIDAAPEYDLAALRLIKPVDRPSLDLPDDPAYEPLQGTSVLLIGNPLGIFGTSSKGSVSNRVRPLLEIFRELMPLMPPNSPLPAQPDQKVIQLQIDSTQGMSGAPVLNLDGRVIGVQKSGVEDGGLGIQFCIPHFYIRDKLDLTKRSIPFRGGVALSSDLQAVGLGKQQRLEGPAVGGVDAGDLGICHWGYVPNDPIFVFNTYLEDRLRFLRMMTFERTRAILNQSKVVHLINPSLRFRILVPNQYTLSQRVEMMPGPPAFPLYEATLTHDDPAIPAPLNRIRIRTWKLNPQTVAAWIAQFPNLRDGLGPVLKSCAADFLTNYAGIRVLPAELANQPSLTENDFFRDDQLSDPDAWFNTNALDAYITLVLHSAPQFDRSIYLYYRLRGDMMMVLSFEYRRLNPQLEPGKDSTTDFLERLFMASTFALY
jgi:hypothetical protein